jgi:phosphatidylinositol alpha 1,6-mannosyltransferase
LSEAYANMDIFVFPSETDAFGNVAQEAIASGVPAIVSNQGGPKFIIRHNETGFVAENFDDFVRFSLELINDPGKLTAMKKQSRERTMASSWDAVFESVYKAYAECIKIDEEKRAADKAAKN